MFIISESAEACRSDFHFLVYRILMLNQRSHHVKISLFSIKCGLIRKIEFSCQIIAMREPSSESDEIVFIDTSAEKSLVDYDKFKTLPKMVAESVDHEETFTTVSERENGSSSSDEKNIEKLPCPVCGKLFNKWFDIKRHMSTHTGEKPFTVKILSRTKNISEKIFAFWAA
jgi:hypothetical protein